MESGLSFKLDLQDGYLHPIGGKMQLFHAMAMLESKDPKEMTKEMGIGDQVLFQTEGSVPPPPCYL